VRRLAGLGKAVLLVEQRARAALQIADWTSVLVSGSMRLEGLPADLLERQDFEELFLGAGTNLAAADDSRMEEA
jgi:branched-chain amino acid transport system ATP-binding protein